MPENYDHWNKIKKDLNLNKKVISINEKEIFMAYIGQNIGFEQNGDKNQSFLGPVLVYKKFSKNLFLGIPLTKTKREGKFYFSFTFKNNKVSTAILSQIKLLDTKRCKYRMGQIKNRDFKELIVKFKNLTDVTP
jgi:mRNA interferase MazF